MTLQNLLEKDLGMLIHMVNEQGMDKNTTLQKPAVFGCIHKNMVLKLKSICTASVVPIPYLEKYFLIQKTKL